LRIGKVEMYMPPGFSVRWISWIILPGANTCSNTSSVITMSNWPSAKVCASRFSLR